MNLEELSILVGIAAEASELVRGVYGRHFEVAYKAPEDPVTEADRAANTLICERLREAFPNCPIVAEESPPETFADFRRAPRVFFVDPVDGTREFVRRNGEFVVMIGVLEENSAVASVIQAPALGFTWVGLVGTGAFQIDADGQRTQIRVSEAAELSQARVACSRSHNTGEVEQVLDGLGAAELVQLGSAGLKGAHVATARADAYVAPHYAGQRWDACAPDALVRAAGGNVSDAFGEPIDYRSDSLYNDRGIVMTNGLLHVPVLSSIDRTRLSRR
ncbi:MAG TPA: 3'(2'),5'-bisphosphate nucleotidase CysQ [Polyangiaceae bacterium]|nr:3'(2'),5'-bisphosphate nucleotidase CysQ [Polyangiaceae bacterium]